jgi:hypothetical protein
MADQNLNIQVAATATGDGLRKTAEEVKALNAETAKSAPIAAEATTREERLAAVRERHAEAARKQAEAEAELDAKREAAFAQLDAMKAQGGGQAQGAGADAGGAGGTGVGAMAGVMAGQIVNEIPQAIQAMINSMEDQRISMQKQTAELSKQVAAWGDMVAAAGTVEDRLKLQLSMHERAAEIMERAAQAPVQAGSYLERVRDNLLMVTSALNSFERTTEYTFETKAREAEEQARIERMAGLQRDKKMIEQHIAREDELKRVSKMTLDERFERETLEIANLEQRRDEALANDQVREAARAQIMIEAAEKRMAAIRREGDELAKALEKERDALEKERVLLAKADEQATRDFNALQEKGAADERAREVAAEEARAGLMAAEFDREEKAKEKAQRERERMEENNARALERVEREARQEAARDAREARRYAPVSGGTTFGAETAPDIHSGPSASFQTLRKSSQAVPAVPDISASQDEVVRAMRALSDQLLRQQRANIEVTRAAQNATSQSYERS